MSLMPQLLMKPGSKDGQPVVSRVNETPSNLGFGKAALALTDNFRIGTWSMEGLPVVGGVVNIPIRYEAAASAAAAPAKP